jgi:diguanylate cyclase (GGDEF)-like protein/PAS domain S-box-containing protein
VSEDLVQLLLIEDSFDDAELLLWHLKKAGLQLEYERVDSEPAMREALARKEWDIIIADYFLPSFSGLAALEIIRQSGVDLPFIIVSGKVGEDTAVEAMKAGAHDYILKGNLARLVPAITRELQEANTRRKRRIAEKELHTLKQAIETIPIGVTISDCSGKIIFTNKAEGDIHGYTLEELIGNNVRIFAPPGLKEERCKDVVEHFECLRRESVNIRKDGTLFPVSLISSVVVDDNGAPVAVVTACEDISERKESEKKLLYMSTHDTLTGFYNRFYFDQEMERLKEDKSVPISVIMLDVDGLKEINDTLGHAAGDKMLKQTASVLLSVFRTEDIIARIGGDEFVVLLPGADYTVVDKAIRRIRDVLDQSATVMGGLGLSLSIGAATAEHPEQLQDTFILADERMYQDKMTKTRRKREVSVSDRRLA